VDVNPARGVAGGESVADPLGQELAGKMGLDRLPRHIIGKRVTEVMDMTGKKAIVTGRSPSAGASTRYR
jgi:hypothetical protein